MTTKLERQLIEDHQRLLASLNDANNQRIAADSNVTKVVTDCRAAGVPWASIGEALAMSRQAAWERYKHVESLAVTEWDWSAHKGGPEGHLAVCAHTNCKNPAKFHVRWGYGCANLCGVHERQMVNRGMGGVYSSGVVDIYEPGEG